jgi:hypothetical protein
MDLATWFRIALTDDATDYLRRMANGMLDIQMARLTRVINAELCPEYSMLRKRPTSSARQK